MSSDADAPFWTALGEGEVRIPRCAGCEAWTWPAAYRCARCGSFDFTWSAVAPEGTVHSWTRTWYAFAPERRDEVPYCTVVVELPAAGGARVLGRFRSPANDDPRIGAPVVGAMAGGDTEPSLWWSPA